ncbi:MAG: hypothetical protein AAF220_12010 [Pseudomonadota bacterium]
MPTESTCQVTSDDTHPSTGARPTRIRLPTALTALNIGGSIPGVRTTLLNARVLPDLTELVG